jgi:AraC family ethanolamine operon transcriptional activator
MHANPASFKRNHKVSRFPDSARLATRCTMQTKTFTEYDAFASSVKDIDARMMFTNARHHRWTISRARLSRLHLQLGRLGSGNIVEGQSVANGLLLYVPMTEACQYRANGTIYEPGSVVVLEPGSEFCLASNAEHDWCSIQLPTDMFTDLPAEPSSSTQKPGVWVSDSNQRPARQAFRLVCDAMTNESGHPEFEGTLAARNIEADLSKIAAEVVGKPLMEKTRTISEGRPALPRDEIIRRCKSLLERHHEEPLRIEDFLNVTQVSERTLRRAFKEYFGIGPSRYLQLRQLHQVRRLLKSSDAESTTVTRLLFGQGVSQLGRFASRYRTLFGELPSETLHAKKNCPSSG